MEGRKTKNGVVKEVFEYIFFAILVAGTILAYLYRADISAYFESELTANDTINQILHVVPKVIISIQIIVCAIALNMILRLVARFTFGLTDKGKTLANIFASLIKWAIIIASILWILSVWGINTEALVAGAGILALVVGLGAQSLIADILAGIFIVLEGEYLVGDIVVIDGWRGKIVSIGIRTTQLEDAGGNIRIINNAEIKSVTNQTKHQSVANCTVNIASNLNLESVENIIKESLATIKQKLTSITGEIAYKGVSSINESSIQLLFSAPCYEEDLYQVERDLNRELKLVLDKNSIPAFAVPMINVSENK